jgi:transcriptional regulator with XRE-family HTH domain
MSTPSTLRRGAGVPANQASLYTQTLGFFMAQANLTIVQLSDRSGVPAYRLSLFLNGTSPVDKQTAAFLAQALKCPAEELVSGPPGVQVSGGAIFLTHAMNGKHLPGVRPLTRNGWLESWNQLDAEGVLPEAASSISREGACPDAHP